ncbi:AEC family transporter [bacterium]|nr:AEC family transporter [bacterium]
MSFNISIIGALVPVFAVILSGYGLRRIGFPGDSFWSHAERLTYFFLFPALFFQKTASASLELQSFALMAASLATAVLIMTVLLFLFLPWWSSGKASFTSFFQGSIRFNTYVGLAAAFAMFGSEGVRVAALCMAVLIPLLNVICVSVLVGFGRTESANGRRVALEVIRNPLVLACTSGLLLNMSGIGLHHLIDDILLLFSSAALPLGLLSVGAGLSFSAARVTGTVVSVSSALKLMVFPFITWMTFKAFNIEGLSMTIAVLFAALPGSPAAYILAKQLGGDDLLMASIIAVQTPLAMVTLPVVMAMLIA